MVTYADISNTVMKLRRRYGESDPFRLAEDMGITMIRYPLGCDLRSIKGFYLEHKKIKSITINSDLPMVIQRVICAHELGHAVLHRRRGICTFQEVQMLDQTTLLEREANIFAAEYLLDDDSVLESIEQYQSFSVSAAQLMVPEKLLEFKLRGLQKKGYAINTDIPCVNFLRDLEIPCNDDDHIC